MVLAVVVAGDAAGVPADSATVAVALVVPPVDDDAMAAVAGGVRMVGLVLVLVPAALASSCVGSVGSVGRTSFLVWV